MPGLMVLILLAFPWDYGMGTAAPAIASVLQAEGEGGRKNRAALAQFSDIYRGIQSFLLREQKGVENRFIKSGHERIKWRRWR